MSTTLEVLQARVMGPSKEDRSRLLKRLVASLDVDPQVEDEWEQLAAQREAELESGFARGGTPMKTRMRRISPFF